MISRILLGNGAEILNVEDVQEVVHNNGEYIKRALSINIKKDDLGQLPTTSAIEGLLRAEGALGNIKIYKKDVISAESLTYGEEYLEAEHSKYTTIQSIIKHSGGGNLSVVLIADPADIAGDKASKLQQENANLKLQLEMTQQALDDLLLGGV